MAAAFVVWSEQNGAWLGPGTGWYVTSLMRCGLYNETDAQKIMRQDNRFLPAGIWHSWAMIDPLSRSV